MCVMNLQNTFRDVNRDYAVNLIRTICALAGPISILDDAREELRSQGLLAAIRAHDTGLLFDWLAVALSFQGIADAVAQQYMNDHGHATWAAISRDLKVRPACPKLSSYWQFYDCRYEKGSRTCAEPDHLPACPLPTYDLRNGRLNQTAYSLFLFIRDVASGDLISWIDQRLVQADSEPGSPDRLSRLRNALLEPLRHVYGVSDKVLSMALSTLLLGAGRRRKRWLEVGASMVAVDSLVHNFLHRTGILQRLEAAHPIGAACYRPNGCAEIIGLIADSIDARAFNSGFPKVFPRFVQLAIWRYCARSGFNVCNGNKIDDSSSCINDYCRVFARCDRIALKTRDLTL
jgi:hypothetical protein